METSLPDETEPGAPPTPQFAEGAPVVRRFERNAAGRDFVVGDIHGMFTSLDRLLEEVAFDAARDRLFSVGDLVDRGPESADALDWLAHDWFHACRGNHEQLALDAVTNEQFELWIRFNGGAWWLDITAEQQERFREAFRRLPMAMEVQTDAGLVGIVHADIPPGYTWDAFMTLLESGNSEAMLYSMWSRNRIQGLGAMDAVGGRADRIFCGHTPTRRTVQLDNVCYIDTGAVYAAEGYRNARLTMVEVQPQRQVEHGVYTHADGPDPESDLLP